MYAHLMFYAQTEWQIFDIHLYAWNFPFWWLLYENSKLLFFHAAQFVLCRLLPLLYIYCVCVCVYAWVWVYYYYHYFFSTLEEKKKHFCAHSVLCVSRYKLQPFSLFATKKILPLYLTLFLVVFYVLSIPLSSLQSIFFSRFVFVCLVLPDTYLSGIPFILFNLTSSPFRSFHTTRFFSILIWVIRDGGVFVVQ